MYTQIRGRATPRTNRGDNALHSLAMASESVESSTRASLRLGACTLLLACAAAAWELIALQSPGTPLYVGVLPGPIGALRELATTIGLLLVAAALVMPRAARGRLPLRALIALLYLGTALGLGAQVYGALHGMYVVQAVDLRADAFPLFVIKYGGLSLLAFGLLELGRRVCFGPERGENPPT
jgi:hypothetical protein